jgi:hypothetical protein
LDLKVVAEVAELEVAVVVVVVVPELVLAQVQLEHWL